MTVVKHKERLRWGRRRQHRKHLSMLERWAIEEKEGWRPHPLTLEHLAMQKAGRLRTDSIESVQAWLKWRCIPYEVFKEHALYEELPASARLAGGHRQLMRPRLLAHFRMCYSCHR